MIYNDQYGQSNPESLAAEAAADAKGAGETFGGHPHVRGLLGMGQKADPALFAPGPGGPGESAEERRHQKATHMGP